ncbi:MAG TPA: hypothetical protein VKQ52_05100, partial [Puia sp.]|nr:hypothetical protein [Puia sp.]
ARSERMQERPNVYKDIIGDHTADVIPFEVSTIYFNGIRYSPRPPIQSYAAYNRYLDSLGYAKYMSASAPDFVLFSSASIDGRCAWTDEARVKLALLDRYRLARMVDGQVVLEKRTAPRGMIKVREEVQEARMNEDIPVKKGEGIEFTQFYVQYNLKGTLRSLFYHSPPINIRFTLENGETRTYKAVKPILADGIILNKFIDDADDFRLLFLSDGRMNADVRSVRIEIGNHGGFRPEIKMVNSWFVLPEKDTRERMADSVKMTEILNGRVTAPVVVMRKE